MSKKQPRIVIVHDWLTNMGGAEETVLAMAEAFPGAPIYTSTYAKEKMPKFHKYDVRTTYLQKLPGPLQKLHKLLPVLRVHAFRKLDLSEFDIIVSSSSAESKQVKKTRPGQVHICYCHTPIRYYWSHYEEYRKNPSFGKLDPLIRFLMPILVPAMRKYDLEGAAGVDVFIANSTETQQRIARFYQRESVVIYPPVNTTRFKPAKTRGDHYATIGRQIPYKRYDLAIKAANKLGKKLIVFGNGPEHDKLVKIAGPTIEFRTNRFGDASDVEYEKIIGSARGFIYAAEEDFGIATVEALAAGAPVVGYDKAGTLDIVKDGQNGILFNNQTVKDVAAAIKKLEKTKFSSAQVAKTAQKFDKKVFIKQLQGVVKNTSIKKLP